MVRSGFECNDGLSSAPSASLCHLIRLRPEPLYQTLLWQSGEISQCFSSQSARTSSISVVRPNSLTLSDPTLPAVSSIETTSNFQCPDDWPAPCCTSCRRFFTTFSPKPGRPRSQLDYLSNCRESGPYSSPRPSTLNTTVRSSHNSTASVVGAKPLGNALEKCARLAWLNKSMVGPD